MTPSVAPVGDQVDTKSRLAMMLLAFFASSTGLARVYIGDKSGMVRLWIYISCIVATLVPFLNIIAALGLLVLLIWGIVDFFTLAKVNDDAFGVPMSSTSRDERAIGYLRITMIILVVLNILVFIGLLLFVSILLMRGPSQVPQVPYIRY